MKLSPDQQYALRSIMAWYIDPYRAQFITLGGFAGTGKTTLIALLKKIFLKISRDTNKNIKIAFCSYTGRATQNLKNGLKAHMALSSKDTVSTIHGLIYDPIENANGIIIGWKKKPVITANIIIVDEASMVDGTIWRDLLSYNVPIIAVGDHGQLPPIKESFNLMNKPILVLERIHRQAAQNPIIQLSINARETGYIEPGRYSDIVIKYSPEDFEYTDASKDLLENYSSDMLVLCGYNSTRIKINQFVRTALGFDLPEPQEGDRVICLKNNHKKFIYNGMLGTIKSINSIDEFTYETEIQMDDSTSIYKGKIYAPQFNSVKPINFTKDRLKIGKSDLFDFGYALTVHKAQGSQANKVVVFEERFPKMDDNQWKRWLYTAVTRAENELYIFGR